MNKKSLAMAMAAVTVVGSAAPVFAADVQKNYTVVQDKYEKLLKDLKAGIINEQIVSIDIKFDESHVDKVLAGESEQSRKDAANRLETLTKNQLKGLGDGKTVDFEVEYVTEKANDGSLTATDINNYLKEIEDNKDKTVVSGGATDAVSGVITYNAGEKKTVAADPITINDAFSWKIDENDGKKVLTITPKELTGKYYGMTADNVQNADSLIAITHKDGATLTLTEGEKKTLKFEESFAFEKSTAKIDGLKLENATPSAVKTATTNVRVIKAVEKTIDVSSNSSTKAKDLAKQYVFKDDNDTDPGNLSYISRHIDTVAILNKDGDYEVTLFPEGKRLNTLSSGVASADAPAKIVLKASTTKKLVDYIDDLITYNNSYSNVQTVAGSDRIETAIELSRKFYNSTDKKALYPGEIDNVVLVGSQAIVDGLVASPLAAEKNAPLLLSSKDKLDSSVKAEIKRVMKLDSSTGIKNNKEVFIAGGINSVSKAVENELKDMGLKVTRLSGDDRYETSLAIADEIDIDDKAYVVGGTGLADAMSIAPVASQLKSGEATPIIVVDGKADKLSKEAEDFLDDAQVDIIGGENSVSAKMEDYIDDSTGKSPERISGADRQATNAEVIKEYFDKDGVENYFLAKDGSTKEDQLVDALAAAAVAGNFGAQYNENGDKLAGSNDVSPAPIILATDNLSAEQHVAVSKTSNSDKARSLIQVGQGIADSVVSKLKDLLDM
ncbi:S-layer protein SlpA [Clostridioides difficile]|nr:S-layer protein SlpA [Clostridioides difficile]